MQAKHVELNLCLLRPFSTSVAAPYIVGLTLLPLCGVGKSVCWFNWDIHLDNSF